MHAKKDFLTFTQYFLNFQPPLMIFFYKNIYLHFWRQKNIFYGVFPWNYLTLFPIFFWRNISKLFFKYFFYCFKTFFDQICFYFYHYIFSTYLTFPENKCPHYCKAEWVSAGRMLILCNTYQSTINSAHPSWRQLLGLVWDDCSSPVVAWRRVLVVPNFLCLMIIGAIALGMDLKL